MNEIQNDQVQPVWIPPNQAEHTHGFKRSLLYELIKNGDVESAVIRKKGSSKGIRLVNAASLDAYIRQHIQK